KRGQENRGERDEADQSIQGRARREGKRPPDGRRARCSQVGREDRAPRQSRPEAGRQRDELDSGQSGQQKQKDKACPRRRGSSRESKQGPRQYRNARQAQDQVVKIIGLGGAAQGERQPHIGGRSPREDRGRTAGGVNVSLHQRAFFLATAS